MLFKKPKCSLFGHFRPFYPTLKCLYIFFKIVPKKVAWLFWATLEKHGFEFNLGTKWEILCHFPWRGVNNSDYTTIQTIYRGTSVQEMSTCAPVVNELWLIELTYMILFVTSMTDSASKMQNFQIFQQIWDIVFYVLKMFLIKCKNLNKIIYYLTLYV